MRLPLGRRTLRSGCRCFPVPEKIPCFVSFRGTTSALNPFSISGSKVPIGTLALTVQPMTYPFKRGHPWVNAGRPAGTKYTCLCRFADHAAVRQNSIQRIFETSRAPVCISTQNSRSIQVHLLNSRSPCQRTRTEALRFWLEPARKLCVCRSFPGKLTPIYGVAVTIDRIDFVRPVAAHVAA